MLSQNSTAPTANSDGDGGHKGIISFTLIGVTFLLLALLAFFRARRSITVLRTTAGPLPTHRFTPIRIFFINVVVHCFLRAIREGGLPLWAILEGYKSPEESPIGSYMTYFNLALRISYQAIEFIYLRIWQLQCDALEGRDRSGRLNFPPRPIVLWLFLWMVALGLDLTFMHFSANYSIYCVQSLFSILNDIVIAAGFLYLGDQLHGLLSMGLGDDSTVFENHVIRAKWFFSTSCILDAVLTVLIPKYPAIYHAFNTVFWGAMYALVLELIPLLVLILSMYYVQLSRETELPEDFSSEVFINREGADHRRKGISSNYHTVS